MLFSNFTTTLQDNMPASGDGYLTETLGTIRNSQQSNYHNKPNAVPGCHRKLENKIHGNSFNNLIITLTWILARLQPEVLSTGSDLEEQWTNLNTTALLHPALCIYGGTMGSSNLAVDAWYDNSWQPISSGLVSGWNNMSINSYLSAGSTTFTIKFSTTTGDTRKTVGR